MEDVGFAAVPFALDWLRSPAEWAAEPARLVVGAPAQTDWFIDPISARAVDTAPVLVGPPPTGDFTWEAHVALDGDAMFDAVGLFVYDDDDHWAKLALEVTAAGPTIVSVVTDTFSDDCNSTVLAQKQRLAAIGACRRGDRLSCIRRRRALGARPGLPSAEPGAAHRPHLPSPDRHRVHRDLRRHHLHRPLAERHSRRQLSTASRGRRGAGVVSPPPPRPMTAARTPSRS